MDKDLTPAEKRRLIISVLISNMIGGTLYLNMASFYPNFVQDHYASRIDSTMVSICMCAFEFAAIVSNPIHAMTISKIGRKNAIILGEFISFVTSAALGLLALINDDNWLLFFLASMIIRFIQGYGDSMSVTTAYSLISSNFTEEKEKYIGYVEAASGIGLIAGPPLAGLLYGFVGFSKTFYAFSLLILLNVINIALFVPGRLNFEKKQSATSKREGLLDKHLNASGLEESTGPSASSELLRGKNLLALNEVGYSKFIKIKGVWMALLICIMGIYSVSFFNSFLSLEIESYGVEEDKVGYYFPAISGPYFVSSILTPIFFTKVPRKISFVTFLYAAVVGLLLMGPASWLGLPDSLAIICVGMGIIGFTCAFVFIPCLPEIIDNVYLRYQITEGVNPELDNKISDTTSSLYMMMISFANLVSPIIGGACYDHLGYKGTIYVSAGLMTAAAVVFTLFHCGWNVMSNHRQFKSDLAELRGIHKKLESQPGSSA